MRTTSIRGPTLALAALLGGLGCRAAPDDSGPTPPGVECLSLLGQELTPPPIPEEDRAGREAALARARAAWEADPGDPDLLIELGRRTAHLNRFREALAWFERGAAQFPLDPRMHRFRGHRLITLRRFAEARTALERASELMATWPDEVELAMSPNASGVELEYLHANIWYHLALASYLSGDLEAAAAGWRRCLEVAPNVDSRCSALHWLHTALSRSGRGDEARALVAEVRADWPVVEYAGYHALNLVYNGTSDPEQVLEQFRAKGGVEFATVAYGIGSWYFARGDRGRAEAIWREIVPDPDWHAFGHIAAEVELSRMGTR
jgi:tetratricopeptide (TPR) repeat protein